MSPQGDFESVLRELRLLCLKYGEWINGLEIMRNTLSPEYLATANRHIENCKACLSRMESGVDLWSKMNLCALLSNI